MAKCIVQNISTSRDHPRQLWTSSVRARLMNVCQTLLRIWNTSKHPALTARPLPADRDPRSHASHKRAIMLVLPYEARLQLQAVQQVNGRFLGLSHQGLFDGGVRVTVDPFTITSSR
ncbi:hypothetical protein M404DRAFT_992082 [Pisolithus tinctorius Marx 270]|uniref:Uncharacterized protein n=1 Tax=Pisolithus tinctorius Marx 270 TaxID=870435 RepID=A0A0C3PWW3_PISTI|nr:hypothetical protein M404DRAFT_992082 [Pisolithus tinctorius Marx 270]